MFMDRMIGGRAPSMVDEHLKCTATLPLYITSGKCRLKDEFFRAFDTLIL